MDRAGDVREALRNGPLLFDGAMGTYIRLRGRAGGCELANLTDPGAVAAVHREYIAAGCEAIKTNTFGANPRAFSGDMAKLDSVISAGWRIACEASRTAAFVFADIGPVGAPDEVTAAAEYIAVADIFLRLGAKRFLFETNSSAMGLAQAAAHIKAACPDAYIIASFAAQPDGYTREGLHFAALLRAMASSGAVDAAGLNCVSGARHMRELLHGAEGLALPLSAMPNAGYPTVVGNRTFYDGDPEYFAVQLRALAQDGAAIVGGCCGTTPAHIAAARRALADVGLAVSRARPRKKASPPAPRPSALEEAFSSGRKVLAVELDPPNAPTLDGFMRGAKRLAEAGADVLTIADCPIARARVDSSLLACKVRRELGMAVMPHLTCRDRNINATKALLLGLWAEDVRDVLAVTGDPIPTAERDEVKTVFQFNSRKLAGYIASLGEHELPAPFSVYGALNLNARSFDVQLALAREKLKAGMRGFLTQPILTRAALDNLARARSELDCRLLAGIMPIVSHKNALFLSSEVNGVSVAPEIVSLYEGAGREEGEALAERISAEVAAQAAPYSDGFYIITPFGRTELVARIMERVRAATQ